MKSQKNLLIRVTALLLALIMVLSMGMTAFAAQETTAAETETTAGTEAASSDIEVEKESSDSETADTLAAGETAEAETEDQTDETEKVPELSLSEVGMIPEGLKLDDVEVGGMTGKEAASLVADKLAKIEGDTVTVKIADQEASITLKDLGFEWTNESAIANALQKTTDGNVLKKYKAIKDVEENPESVKMTYDIDTETANTAISAVADPLNVEPQNATIVRNADGTWTITPEVVGIVTNVDGVCKAIGEKIASKDWDGGDLSLEAETELREPPVKSDVYEGMSTTPIASFSTEYAGPLAVRNQNVETAAAHMNGHMFLPGEEMSTNAMIAPVTVEGGYGMAAAYIDGSVTDSIGGGICQVATTYYNACLLLELEIVTRKNHSKTVFYVPYGMDATIFPADGLDFVARNSTGHALYVESFCQDGQLFINFYGVDDRPANRTVQYQSVTLLDEDPGWDDQPDTSLPTGQVKIVQDPHHKVKAQLFKQVYVDGQLTENTLLHTDSYAPSIGIRRYGPAFDAAGTMYYIDFQGYAVAADGTKYVLNPDGSWNQNPPANLVPSTTETETAPETKESETKKPETKKEETKPTAKP